MKKLILFLIVWIISIESFASQVVRISEDGRNALVSNRSEEAYDVEDMVCIFNGVRDYCGEVTVSNEKGAVIRLLEKSDLKVGDRVRLASGRLQPLASLKEEEFVIRETRDPKEFLLSAGTNLIYPAVNLHAALTNNYALAGLGQYYELRMDGVINRSWGMLVALEYYSERPFVGLWMQAGLGVYTSELEFGNLKGFTRSDTAILTAGWRFQIGDSLNIGIAAGAQWIRARAKNGLNDFNLNAWVPNLSWDMGFVF